MNDALELYRRKIAHDINCRVKGETYVIVNPDRDTLHIYTMCKNKRYDFLRQKVSDLIFMKVPHTAIVAEYIDKYFEFVRDMFFKPNGTETHILWKEVLKY